MSEDTKSLCTPVAAETWTPIERAAWIVPRRIKPSRWAEAHFRIRRGEYKGPYRNDNAPYLAGIMDIATRPGCVQANVSKAGQIGGSTALRAATAWKAHTDPAPMGLTLPSRDKGRQLVKSDWQPLFRHTRVLRDLIGSEARDMLIESISLLNGFQLDLMWSGSATSMASQPMQMVINDEVDKFEAWTGEEPDAVAATEVRLTSYGDRRLQINVSTPTTTAGTIHNLCEQSSVKLLFHVPCPHCGHYQPLRWNNGMQWLNATLTALCVDTCGQALAAGDTSYAAGGSTARFAAREEMQAHHDWLLDMKARFEATSGRRAAADLLAGERDRALWYVCEACRARIGPRDKIQMVRRGRWSSPAGPVTDYWGKRHEDASDVERWPNETRIAFNISALYCLWVHWGSLVGQWLRAQDDPAALFMFVTNRLAEPFEFRNKRVAETVFSGKCRRAGLDPGVVPRWAWLLLMTIDTQADHFYYVIRAWGGGMRSQRVAHGKVLTFDELDRLIFVQRFVQDGGDFPPMAVAAALIDSGGTADSLLDASRTQQVYVYAIPRQPVVRAIKGASRPGVGLYWPMKNPMASGETKAQRGESPVLAALMVDKHRCNDLLAALISAGVPAAGHQPEDVEVREQWLLNALDDPEYNTQMSNMQGTIDRATKAAIWTERAPGARHDYRDCEAYQIALAYLAEIPGIPPDDADVIGWKQQLLAGPTRPPPTEDRPDGNSWTPRSL